MYVPGALLRHLISQGKNATTRGCTKDDQLVSIPAETSSSMRPRTSRERSKKRRSIMANTHIIYRQEERVWAYPTSLGSCFFWHGEKDWFLEQRQYAPFRHCYPRQKQNVCAKHGLELPRPHPLNLNRRISRRQQKGAVPTVILHAVASSPTPSMWTNTLSL